MFKTSSSNTNTSFADISVMQTPCYSVGRDVLHELSLLKNNVAILQADVHVLKSESRDLKIKVETHSQELGAEIQQIKI